MTADANRPYTFYPPQDVQHVRIIVVGTGGTGSNLVDGLAGMLLDLQECRSAGVRFPDTALGRYPISLALVDPDRVEEKNLGRQRFAWADVGSFKAQVLSERYRHAFGVASTFHTVPFDARDPTIMGMGREFRVIVACVDNREGRVATHAALAANRWRTELLLLDAGNTQRAGQVLLGTTSDIKALQGAFNPVGACTALPAPGLVNPALLQQEDASSSNPLPRSGYARHDCAARVLAREQSLTINRHIADAALEILYRLLTGDLTHWGSYTNMVDGHATRSLPLTPNAMAAAVGSSVAGLGLIATPRRMRA